MSKFTNDASASAVPQQTTGGEAPKVEASQQVEASQPENLASLFNYPAIARLLENSYPQSMTDMRRRMEQTRGELERVVRQGTKEDAERAARVLRAYEHTSELLNTLERMRVEQSGTGK